MSPRLTDSGPTTLPVDFAAAAPGAQLLGIVRARGDDLAVVAARCLDQGAATSQHPVADLDDPEVGPGVRTLPGDLVDDLVRIARQVALSQQEDGRGGRARD